MDVSTVLAIANCESGFNSQSVGDHGTSFGVFQLHLPAHRDITREQALDPSFNIRWSIDEMKQNGFGIWSCYKMVKPTEST